MAKICLRSNTVGHKLKMVRGDRFRSGLNNYTATPWLYIVVLHALYQIYSSILSIISIHVSNICVYIYSLYVQW